MYTSHSTQLFQWPVVTDEILSSAKEQIRRCISIYDEGDVYGEFEREFSKYIGHKFAICTSSGTAALHSVFYGLGVGKDDEVITCDYGFFATVAPAIHMGVTVRFVDCAMNGCVDAKLITSSINPRTKAVVVTHMWGAAAPMHQIRRICDDYKLALVEDCSHAHGTMVEGQVAGSFGDAAIWSLQAKKPLWAGEGGILCTSNREIFEKALLLGHFNARALNQIPADSPNRLFAFTGTGLKYRAHPVGIAMALCQLPRLNELIEGRQPVASLWADALQSAGNLHILSRSMAECRHSYYSLVAVLPRGEPKVCSKDLAKMLKAAGIEGAGVPRQMTSISAFPLFDKPSAINEWAPNSAWISSNAINLFIPSMASPNVCDEDVKRSADTISRVVGEFFSVS